MSVPGLFLAPEMARNLGLTDDERKAVADAFARARDDLAKELVRIAVDSGGAPDPARLMQARHEAEGAAREGLRASLPAAKLEALGRFQEKAGAQSRVSLSMERGSGPPGPKEPVTPPIWGGEKPLGIEPAPDDEGGDVREF